MTTITISREPASGWNGAALLGWYTFWKNLTNPFSIGFAILLPIGMYFMFGTGQSYSDIWTVNGNVAATVLVSMTLYGVFLTVASLATNAALERTSGISRLYATTPLSPIANTCARIGASMGIAVVITGITYAVGAATGAKMYASAWIQTPLLILASSILASAQGLAIAFAVRSDGAFAASSAVTVFSGFLSGMFIPISQMGSFFQAVAPYAPMYGITSLVQLPLYGWETFKWSYVVNLVAWTLFFILLAAWAQRRDTSR